MDFGTWWLREGPEEDQTDAAELQSGEGRGGEPEPQSEIEVIIELIIDKIINNIKIINEIINNNSNYFL